MPKNLSAKHYQESKERLQKKLVNDIKIFQKKKNKKGEISFLTIQKSTRSSKTKACSV